MTSLSRSCATSRLEPWTHRHTHRTTTVNPRCACAPRVNNTSKKVDSNKPHNCTLQIVLHGQTDSKEPHQNYKSTHNTSFVQKVSNSLITASLCSCGSPSTSIYVCARIFSAKASTMCKSPSQSRDRSCCSVSRLTRDLSATPLFRASTPTICSPAWAM